MAAALGPTCTHVPASRHTREEATALPPESYYEAGGVVPPALARDAVDTTASHRLERILIPPRLTDQLASVPRSMDPIEVFLYTPRDAADGPRPLIVMSPILGNSNLLVDGFARAFATHGWVTAIVQRKELAFHPEISLRRAEDEVRLVVMRSRQALDWLLEEESVDPARIGTFGFSAGSIVSSMLAGADARLRCHLWMMAGGPLTDVMLDTVEPRFRDYERRVRARTRQSKVELRHLLRQTIRTDPLRLAPRVERSTVLLILARFDRSVPYRYGLALWRALGRPERLVCPFGHYTSILLLPWLRSRAFRFFRGHFEADGS